MRPLALVSFLALIGPAALAFQPLEQAPSHDDEHAHGDHGAMEPTRIYSFDIEVQRTLRASTAWQDFVQGEGAGWTVRFDEATGEPLRAFGKGLDVGVIDTPEDAVRAVRAFLGRNAAAFNISPKALGQGRASYSEDAATWYIDVPVMYDGSPIWRGGLTARIKHGKLVMVGSQAYTETPKVGSVALDANQAASIAVDLGPAPGASHDNVRSELVWLPWEGRNGLELVRAWEVRSFTAEPVGEWVSFVDAETGELLTYYNEVVFIDGQVQARVHPRTLNDSLANAPLVGARITGQNGARTATDASGRFSVAGNAFRVELRGTDLIVRDQANGNNIPSFDSANSDLVLTADVMPQPALSTWVAVHTVRDFMARFSSTRVGGTDRDNTLTANINVSGGTCNAFYSSQNGSINFFVAGGGCNNTGLLADVIYHEWGHAFHRWSLNDPRRFDGSLSEGIADTVAFLQTNDNIIAPTFRTNGGGIRDVAPNRRYPENFVTDQRAVHSNGLIFGGAMWDLVAELEGTYGREGANEIVGNLLADAIRAGTGIPTIGEEILLADDDDGDLSNGTPHYCEIITALEPHGLAPALAFNALVEHEQVVQAEPDAVTLTAAGAAVDLSCVDIDDINVIYRANGGEWQSAPMSGADGSVEATLTGLPYGTFVEYYLDAGSAAVPRGGVRNPLSLFVGGVIPVWSTDFEADDGGFTSELLVGDASSAGANDWQWGTPNARPASGRGGTTVSGDPDGAYSGNNAWGNDLGNVLEDADGNPQFWNGQYQPERHNRLSSPTLQVPPHLEGVFLRYARWLTVEDGYFDNAQILADGEVVWTNFDSGQENASASHEDRRWVLHSVDLDDATADGEVVLSWDIITDGGAQFGGWNIDDVALVAPATPNNRLAIIDLQAGDDEEGGPMVTWTNPAYAPVERVFVIRKEDSLPTGPDDGEVVFEDTAPELGASNFFRDTTGKRNQVYYYAAYGDDGQDALGWTVEGWNADAGSGFGQSDGVAGCSCDANASPAHLAWLGLGGLVLFLRRRRQD